MFFKRERDIKGDWNPMSFKAELQQAKKELFELLPPEIHGKLNKVFYLYNSELKKRYILISRLSERLKGRR